jgi:hypothetical protein
MMDLDMYSLTVIGQTLLWGGVTRMMNMAFILVNFLHLIHIGERITDDLFVLASQVSQVYYVADERIPN